MTAIQKEGLASVVTAERFATGSAIYIREHWRCQDEHVKDSPGDCWVRRPPGREIDKVKKHYPMNASIPASWAATIT